jgi:heme/copper-type cytochrome/quinol oxidase subunit 1
MRWTFWLRASRFFVSAGAAWVALGILPWFRGAPSAGIGIDLHDRYVVVSATLLSVFAGSVLVIFDGVYGLFEQRHGRQINLILGQIHFWLTVAPLAALFRALWRFASGAGASGGDLNLQAIVQAEMRVFLWSLAVLLLGQFVFLANLAVACFRRPADAC